MATIDDKKMERTEYAGVRIVIPPESKQLGVKLGAKAERIFRILDNDGNVFLNTYSYAILYTIHCIVGNLEVTCYTNVSGDVVKGRNVQLIFEANQDAEFWCGIYDQSLIKNCK